MPRALVETGRPRGLLRWIARQPLWLYRARLGWLLGNRFLMLTHTCRKSGLPRHVVLEVVRHDKTGGTCVVAAAWGEKADWFRNIMKDPEAVVQVGARRFEAIASRLSSDKAEAALRDYARRYPLAFRELASVMMGRRVKGDETDCHSLAQFTPLVALRPKTVQARSG